MSNACSYEPPRSVLSIVDSSISDRDMIGADEPIRLIFNDYLSLNNVSTDGIKLSTGDLNVDIFLSYDPVDRALLITPKRNLRVGVGYTLKVNPNSVFDYSEQRGNLEAVIYFRADRPIGRQVEPISYQSDIEPIFANQCGCHGFDDYVAPNLKNWGSLVDRPSHRQPEFDVIRAGRPLDSYLILRILPDYPTVLGADKTISKEDARRLVRWIRQLAPQQPI